MSKSLIIGDVTVPGRVLMAPMTGVTDLPFRILASKLGAAYVATEMVAAKELARARPDVVRRAAVGARAEHARRVARQHRQQPFDASSRAAAAAAAADASRAGAEGGEEGGVLVGDAPRHVLVVR